MNPIPIEKAPHLTEKLRIDPPQAGVATSATTHIANPMQLTNRTILVSGASSGIGRATSCLLGQLGAKVILVGRNEQRLSETANQIDSPTVIQPFDLTARAEIKGWLKSLSKEHGPLDGLVHCAGLHATGPLRMMSDEKFDEIMHVNFRAGVSLARAFCGRGVHADQSSLVFVSSVMGLVGCPAVSAYVASKTALIGLAKSLALEFAPSGIRVNCVAPGQVDTEMTRDMQQNMTEEQFAAIESLHPLGIGTPIDVANSIAFLLSDTGRWITGTTLVVDGGYTAH